MQTDQCGVLVGLHMYFSMLDVLEVGVFLVKRMLT